MQFLQLKFTVLCLLTSYFACSQEFIKYSSYFSIIEKNEISKSTSIIKGNLTIDNAAKEMLLDVSFPAAEKWLVKDSFLTKFVHDTVQNKTKIAGFEKLSLYNELINLHKSDYGLKQLGFEISNISSENGRTVVTWKPPIQLKDIIGAAVTEVEDNLLLSIHIFDEKNMEILASYISNYVPHNGIPIPLKVISKVTTDKGAIFKSMEFKDVSIN